MGVGVFVIVVNVTHLELLTTSLRCFSRRQKEKMIFRVSCFGSRDEGGVEGAKMDALTERIVYYSTALYSM